MTRSKFQSTPSVGRATITGGVDAAATYAISIHALRGEGDLLARIAIKL